MPQKHSPNAQSLVLIWKKFDADVITNLCPNYTNLVIDVKTW